MTELQDRLISPPILALQKAEGKYTVDTDACDKQVGCVLSQDQSEGVPKQIGYWSRWLNKAERSYETTHRECLGLVWEILILRPYLEGRRFKVRRDHDSFRWIVNMADASGKLARWRLRLQELEFDVVHRACVKNQAAYALYRLETSGEDRGKLEDDVPILLIGSDARGDCICDHCDAEPDLGPMMPEVFALDGEEEKIGPTIGGVVRSQAADTFCQEVAATVEKPGSAYSYDCNGVLVRTLIGQYSG